MASEPDAVLTIDELAEYLKIVKSTLYKSTLYKLAQQGRTPAQNVDRHWRFRKAAIARFLARSGGPDGVTGDREDG